MMRDIIAPALREMGFKGSAARALEYHDGDYGVLFSTQKSVHNNRNHVSFAVHLTAWHDPSEAVYWSRQLRGLVPGLPEYFWVISDTKPADPVGEEVLAAFHRYGWPAMQAALDNPGFPADPDAHWSRTFPLPPCDGGHAQQRRVPQSTGTEHDALFADLGDADPRARLTAAYLIGDNALNDPRAIPALLYSLQHDPSPDVRRMAGTGLRYLASRDDVRHALQLAAAEDEDLQVRWEARYAIKLADLRNAPAD
jgi:hypothetical protein